MRHFNRLLLSICVLSSTTSHAASLFIEALHWRTSETVDWVLSNQSSGSQQEISYHTISFDSDTGLRIGFRTDDDWGSKVYLTKFHTNSKASASGQLTPAFLGGKLSGGTFTQGNISFDIDYLTLDAELNKPYIFNDNLILTPAIGLKGGRINQKINTDLNGSIFTTEKMQNDFWGVGPKFGIDIAFTSWRNQDSSLSLFTNFSTAYLFGDWDISDKLYYNPPSTGTVIDIETSPHSFGSLMFQAAVGVNYTYQKLSFFLNYEINDWFDQGQIFDDASGGHNNDLVLQGFNAGLNWHID